MRYLTSDQHELLELFNLSDKDVERTWYENINGTARIHTILSHISLPCPDCGCEHPKIKDYRLKKIVHSVLTDRECDLIYHARRFICPVCRRTYYEHNPFVFKKQKLSALTVERILTDLKSPNETFTSVALRYRHSCFL